MLELALHILDIAENSVRARARKVTIEVTEDSARDLLTIAIEDDGRGMNPTALDRALDPFYTTKKVRNVGLGLPLLAKAAEQAGGRLAIRSEEGVGTRLEVEFRLSHIDRQPLGDVAGVLVALIAGNPDVDFIYRHCCNARLFTCDTRDIRREIEDLPITQREVLKFVRDYVRQGLKEIGTQA
ncbi:MAG: ATP-binding protein [Deltaproteobacteria bacterium]|nr:ATP-binding protein [Deltaproteobacteria bacterium]